MVCLTDQLTPGTHRHLPALSVVVNLDVVELLVLAGGGLGLAKATFAVDLAV